MHYDRCLKEFDDDDYDDENFITRWLLFHGSGDLMVFSIMFHLKLKRGIFLDAIMSSIPPDRKRSKQFAGHFLRKKCAAVMSCPKSGT